MEDIKEKTWKNLEKYANFGLRTLAIAKREIPEELYKKWSEEYLVNITKFFFFLNLY